MTARQQATAAENENPIRTQALDLFDRCLAQGDPAPIVAFIERQIAMATPDLELFRSLADDLQQRLLTMRSHLYDLREQVVNSFQDTLTTDITPIVPPEALYDYHLINPEIVVAYVSSQGQAITDDQVKWVRTLIASSIKVASRLNLDMLMTEGLYEMVLDWFDALCAVSANRWEDRPPAKGMIH